MYSCPVCQLPMQKKRLANGHCHRCSEGHGTSVGIYLLQRNVDSEALRQIWAPSKQTPRNGLLPCPSCKKSMQALRLTDANFPFELDACRHCHLIWFDEDEFFAMRTNPKHKRLNRTLLPAVEKEIALAQVQFDQSMRRESIAEEKKILETALRMATSFNPPASKATWAVLQVARFLVRWL